MLHVLDVGPVKTEKAFGAVLLRHGYSLSSCEPILTSGPGPQADASDAPAYIIGPQLGRWTPIIDLHAEPWPGEVCRELSRACSSDVLSLMVHDDGVMCYNLDRRGGSVDGYNSNPQYFESERLSMVEIQSQRHAPDAFQPVLPSGKSVEEMRKILDSGWWQVHDAGRLDANGTMTQSDMDSYPYVSEGQRMTALGTFLGIAGFDTEYPFADWRENQNINWPQYKLLQYASKPSLLERLFGKKT